MQCPYCNHKECKVIDSRHTDSKSIRRRRECEACKKRFTTYEKIETTPIMVIKKDNTREYFDGDKIKYGILKSCEKRPVSVEQIEEIVAFIENEINNYRNQLKVRNIEDINNKLYQYQDGVYYMDMLGESEKMGDYIINVVQAFIEKRI